MTRKRTGLSALAALSVLTVGVSGAPVTAIAQQAAPDKKMYTFRIEAGTLSRVLALYSEVSGVQLVYDSEFVKGVLSEGLTGSYSAEEALTRLLGRSGLQARFTSSTTATVVRTEAHGARTLGPVRVEGAAARAAVNGINGSRDVTATEGTGSYTTGAMTVGSKTPQSIKDTPYSVSVITAQQLEDQNIGDLNTALDRASGVTMVQGGGSVYKQFFSRGFQITAFQVDGGAPLLMSTGAGTSGSYEFYPLIDMSEFDHVELWRGASGTFNGYGDPSGTINLVRKKPLDHPSVSLEAQTGSWDTYRAVLDASSPLALDGALRGRVVLTYQDNHQFYDVAKDNKTVIYGIADYDLTPQTLIAAGFSHTRQDSVPWYNGLPRYQNGDDLKLPRSASFALPWNLWSFSTSELFTTVDQRLGDRWLAKLNVTRSAQETAFKYGYFSGTVDPQTLAGMKFTAGQNSKSVTQWTAEATLSGHFQVLGQEQKLVFGINYADSDGSGDKQYVGPVAGTPAAPYQPYAGGPTFCSGSATACPNGAAPTVTNPFTFDPNDPLFTEPRDSLPNVLFRRLGRVQTLAYLNLNLTAFDRWHLSTGVRYSRYQNDYAYDGLCITVDAKCQHLGDVSGQSIRNWSDDSDFSWPPSGSVSYDVNRDLTAYVSYSDIFISQGSYLTRDLETLPPIRGANMELGLKWQAPSERVNGTWSVYRIERKGQVNPSRPGLITVGGVAGYQASNGQFFPGGVVDLEHTCCYLADRTRKSISEGVDTELNGALFDGFEISGSYTFSRNRQSGSGYGASEGKPFTTLQPEHLLKLWMSYDFRAVGQGDESWLSRLGASTGVTWKSKAYKSGTACVESIPGAIVNGVQTYVCAPGKNIPYDFTQDPYAVWSARIDYALGKNWNIALNGENILDKRYYQTMGTSTDSNWYGAPRSYTLTLHGKW